jgi:hypothetical protein
MAREGSRFEITEPGMDVFRGPGEAPLISAEMLVDGRRYPSTAADRHTAPYVPQRTQSSGFSVDTCFMS